LPELSLMYAQSMANACLRQKQFSIYIFHWSIKHNNQFFKYSDWCLSVISTTPIVTDLYCSFTKKCAVKPKKLFVFNDSVQISIVKDKYLISENCAFIIFDNSSYFSSIRWVMLFLLRILYKSNNVFTRIWKPFFSTIWNSKLSLTIMNSSLFATSAALDPPAKKSKIL